jgi:hypothetical protein
MKFGIRDLLWLTAVIGLGVALVITYRQASALRVSLDNEVSRNELIPVLWRPTNIDFVNVPLNDAVKYLSSLHAIPFALDGDVNGAAPITGKFDGVPLRTGLQGILEPNDLDFRIKEGAVQIQNKSRPK